MRTEYTDDEFIAAWRELGSPTLVAERLGVNVRNIHVRRNHIQNKLKIELPTEIGRAHV